MQIIIRMDDITPDMDWDKFSRVRGILEKKDIKPLIGIVPICKDENLSHGESNPDFWKVIEELKAEGWDVAQHGTYHIYETEEAGLLGINPFSEFAGLGYEEQLEKLRIGQEELVRNGINTDIFMAPGHTYDINTLKALHELGFRALTDGLSDMPYNRECIICIPCRLERMDRLNGLDTLCLHTNTMSEADIAELERFVNEHEADIVSFSEVLMENKAIPYSDRIGRAEQKMLDKRNSRNRVANSERLSWYLSYTNHSNSKIKWLKRVVYLPLLLTGKYKG